MLAQLVCRDRACRASYEAEGDRASIMSLRCEDCHGPLRAVGWADSGEPDRPGNRVEVTRAA